MEESTKLMTRLISLCQLDIDAVQLYTHSIEKIDVVSVRDNLVNFRSDHERHITDLSAIIERLGGEVPERKPDLKGRLLEGFTALRSVTGTEGALKAMQSNEKLTNKTYEEALAWEGLNEETRNVIARNREDERRHLDYISKAIDTRVWETGKQVA